MSRKKIFSSIKPSLLTLTIGGFCIGMTEFMMMGVLPDVAKTLVCFHSGGGSSYFGLCNRCCNRRTADGSHCRQIFTQKSVDQADADIWCFNALFAMAPTYPLLLYGEVVCGFAAWCLFWYGCGGSEQLADKGKEARAVALMFAGLTIANIIGVPLGTYIGHNYSWRMSFYHYCRHCVCSCRQYPQMDARAAAFAQQQL